MIIRSDEVSAKRVTRLPSSLGTSALRNWGSFGGALDSERRRVVDLLKLFLPLLNVHTELPPLLRILFSCCPSAHHLLSLTSDLSHHVFRTTDVWTGPASGFLGLGSPGTLQPSPTSVDTSRANHGVCIVVQSRHPRCRRWYRPAFVAVDEAEPPCLPAGTLRHPHGPRSVGPQLALLSERKLTHVGRRCRCRYQPHQHQEHCQGL